MCFVVLSITVNSQDQSEDWEHIHQSNYMHQELNHGSKVRAAVGVRGCRSIQTLSRLLVSPLCDLSIYVGFLILEFFFEKKTLSISFGKKQHDISNSSCFLEGNHFYIFFPIIVQLIRKQLISSYHFYWHAAFLIDYVLCHFTVHNEA